MPNKSIIAKAIDHILDNGLKNSTWASQFPEAYADLVQHYRRDIILQAEGFIARMLPKAPDAWSIYSEHLGRELRSRVAEAHFKSGWMGCVEHLFAQDPDGQPRD